MEQLAIDRAKALFGSEHANVQPHSGAQANMAVCFALLKPGDTILGMNLAHGGHLTHGSPVNFSGSYFNVVGYGVSDDNHLIDYNEVERLAKAHRPKLIIAGASAYPRIIDFKRFADIAREVGALLMVDMAHIAGLWPPGCTQPVGLADAVTSTTHKTLRGARWPHPLPGGIRKAIDKAVFPGIQGSPLMHVIAAKAVLRRSPHALFKEYQRRILKNASALAGALTEQGFTLVSGGTDNHLMLADLRAFNITGKDLEKRLDSVNITVNKTPYPTTRRARLSQAASGRHSASSRGFDEPTCAP